MGTIHVAQVFFPLTQLSIFLHFQHHVHHMHKKRLSKITKMYILRLDIYFNFKNSTVTVLQYNRQYFVSIQEFISVFMYEFIFSKT